MRERREREREREKKKESILLNLPRMYVCMYIYVCTRNGLDEGRREVMCADAQTIHDS
jgi:hypothetical protein